VGRVARLRLSMFATSAFPVQPAAIPVSPGKLDLCDNWLGTRPQ